MLIVMLYICIHITILPEPDIPRSCKQDERMSEAKGCSLVVWHEGGADSELMYSYFNVFWP